MTGLLAVLAGISLSHGVELALLEVDRRGDALEVRWTGQSGLGF